MKAKLELPAVFACGECGDKVTTVECVWQVRDGLLHGWPADWVLADDGGLTYCLCPPCGGRQMREMMREHRQSRGV